MSDHTPLSDATLAQLVSDVAERTPKMAERSKLEDDLAILNARILSTLQEHNCKRLQLPSGDIVQIVQQADRQTIVKEKLAEQGVSVKIIAAATVASPVRPFIRVSAVQPLDSRAHAGDGDTAHAEATSERVQ